MEGLLSTGPTPSSFFCCKAVFCYNPHYTSLRVPATTLHKIKVTQMSRTTLIGYVKVLRISQFFCEDAVFCYNPHKTSPGVPATTLHKIMLNCFLLLFLVGPT